MSDVVDLNNFGLSARDNYTNFLVNNYMKIPSTSHFSYLVHFPVDITAITVSYIGDHFMIHRGSYKWIVNAELLTEMCAAGNMQSFDSDKFTIGNLQ